MSYPTFISVGTSNNDKENGKPAAYLTSPLMVSAPKAHSTPLDSPELGQVRKRAKECLQHVLGSTGDFRSLPLEYCKNCRSNHPAAQETALLTLGGTENTLSPKKRLEQFIRHLQHATDCKNADCYSLTCEKAKKLLVHVNSCRDCEVYSQLMALVCEHSKSCNGKACSIVYCEMIRQLESPRTARKRLREEQHKGRTPVGKKTRNTNSLKETPLARSAKINQFLSEKDVNVVQVESPGVTGAFVATVSSPGYADPLLKYQMSGKSELEEGEIISSDDENETSDCSGSDTQEDFHRIVAYQKDLYNEIMEGIACKESGDMIDKKYQQFQQETFDAFKAADALVAKSLDHSNTWKIREEVDQRFMKASKLNWRPVTDVTVVKQKDESSMEHHESCRILDETDVIEESRKVDLIKIPLYEKTVKTVYRKVEKPETSQATGTLRISTMVRSLPGKVYRGIAAVLCNGMVLLLIIAYFLYFINN